MTRDELAKMTDDELRLRSRMIRNSLNSAYGSFGRAVTISEKAARDLYHELRKVRDEQARRTKLPTPHT